ncbi:MAG TPA: hypothetical protein VFZ34_09680, partial [Blastocatellia bacterium]|nr:hypothetical protein [Blastocatellia bacterium]
MQTPKLLHFLLLSLLAVAVVAQSKPAKTEAKKLKPRVVPTLQLENGVIVSQAPGYHRTTAQTVCAGDKVAFTARVSGTDDAATLPVKWTVTGGQGASDAIGRYVLDTTGLATGTYIVTAEVGVPYKECEGNCTAYDSKSFVVVTCPSCFSSPSVTLTSNMPVINPGEAVTICASAITGGVNYGTLRPTWTTTAGKITGDANCAKLDTTGIPFGSRVTVNLLLTTDLAGCEAKGQVTLKVAEQQVENYSELEPCKTFKPNNARVDNVCKALLVDMVRQLEANPSAQLVIDSYSRPGEKASLAVERGKNVRDRMADGSIGVRVDANRLIVRPSGQTDEDGHVRFYLKPAGAAMP